MPEYVFPESNVIWSARDVVALCCRPGFMSPDDWRAVTFTAIIRGESGFNPLAISKAIWAPDKPYHRSVDLGLVQLNSHWNVDNDPYPDVPRVSVSDTLDPFVAFNQAWKMMNKQRVGWAYNWNAWVVFKTGAYDRYVFEALTGMREYRASMLLPVGVFGPKAV